MGGRFGAASCAGEVQDSILGLLMVFQKFHDRNGVILDGFFGFTAAEMPTGAAELLFCVSEPSRFRTGMSRKPSSGRGQLLPLL